MKLTNYIQVMGIKFFFIVIILSFLFPFANNGCINEYENNYAYCFKVY